MATSTTDLSGLFKQAYADDLIDLVPEASILRKNIDFVSKTEKLGDAYNQPVIVAQEHGVSYAGPNSGAFTLNPSITMKTQNAIVGGYQMLLRSALDYESAAKASSSVNAFRDATQLQVENMLESINKRLEIALLYGQSATGLGSVASSANGDATHTVITFNAGQWASGLWSGTENASIDYLRADGTTKVNTVGALTVVSVDVTNKKITVSGAAADIAAVDAWIATPHADGVVKFYGASGNEMVGLDKIMLNTGSLFNIDASVYSLWKANTYAVGGNLTQAIVNKAIGAAQARGLAEDVDLIISPLVWGYLNNDAAANRRYQGDNMTKVDTGAKVIEYHSQNGVIRIHSHIFCKEGDGFMLPFERAKRIGAQDVSFKIPGSQEGEIFRQLTDQAGFEFRVYTNQSLIVETPAKCVKLTGITAS